ncbi:MAG: repressor LexA [Planctomycetota bacterium]|jgi:repressor LexA
MNQIPLTRRQREILDYLSEYTESQGISPTLEEIAQHFGVNKVTIFGHVGELERKGVIERAAPGISRGLRIVTDDEEPAAATRELHALDAGSSIDVLGNIAAGSPIEAIESPEKFNFNAMIPEGRDVYALRVNGNSMIEDSIRDGDLVLIEKRSTARNGETVVAIIEGDSATLKRYYKEDGHIRLQPANATMEPIIVDDIEIRGVLIGVVRQFGLS